jgi:hypothetical protein
MLINRVIRWGTWAVILACAFWVTSMVWFSSRQQGYDFSILDERLPWIGPKVGEKIDLTRLRGRNGEKFVGPIDDQLSMLALVEPNCYMCKMAADEMQDVHDRVANHGVKYYIVSFSTFGPASEFFSFTDSLGMNAPAFLWDMGEGKPPATLLAMVTPSHLLIDRYGVIVRKWPGANSDQATRKKMANQIVSDTLAVSRF